MISNLPGVGSKWYASASASVTLLLAIIKLQLLISLILNYISYWCKSNFYC
jgi:hypothetical protein